jgi:hypothetical protein
MDAWKKLASIGGYAFKARKARIISSRLAQFEYDRSDLFLDYW